MRLSTTWSNLSRFRSCNVPSSVPVNGGKMLGVRNSPATYCNSSGPRSNLPPVRRRAFWYVPHPEHAVEPAIGGSDGLAILGSLVDALARGPR